MSIGENIKELRLQHNMSQLELAKIIGVTDKAVSSWENNIKTPRMGTLQRIADYFNIKKSEIIEGPLGLILESKPHTLTEAELKQAALNRVIARDKVTPIKPVLHHSYRIPILGRVAAGNPIYASEDVIGYQYIDESFQDDGYEYFALIIKGQSMEPTIMDGDTVIIRKQDYIEDGQIAIVLIDGEDATAKEVKETPEGIVLIGHNTAVYQPHFYSRQEIQELPVQIIGRVVQSIRKF